MSKRNWSDHPAIGRVVTFNGEDATVVDVKSGPLLFDTSSLTEPEAKISGTLKLKLKLPGGAEIWTPPIDGNQVVSWCEKEDSKHD